MATNDTAAAITPLLVVDIHDLTRAYRESVVQTLSWVEEYTADYTYEKSDIAATPAAAVTTPGRFIMADVHALCGWCITETTGAAAAQFRFFDGNANTGAVLGSGKLAQGTTTFVFTSDRGVRCSTGRIFIQVVAGSVEGLIYWR